MDECVFLFQGCLSNPSVSHKQSHSESTDVQIIRLNQVEVPANGHVNQGMIKAFW